MLRLTGIDLLHRLRAAPARWTVLAASILLAACASAPPTDTIQASTPVAAPATQSDLDALRTLVAQQDRLYRVAAPLLVNNAELCKGHARNLLGFTAKNRYSYSTDYIAASQQLLGLGERLQVMGVLAGSGASRAGVKRGDVLVAIEDTPLPQGANAERDAAAVLVPLVTNRSDVRLTVSRGGANTAINLPLTYACAFGFELGNADTVNAYADGHRILVTRGMLNAARSDDELAYVLAKEMAHNILWHPSRLRMNATVGGIIDNLTQLHPDMSTMVGTAGVKPMPAEFDTMADRLSLYLVARAGYNSDRAVAFWQRFAAQYPPSMPNAYSALHPSTAQRIEAMEKTAALIRSKKAARKPLLP